MICDQFHHPLQVFIVDFLVSLIDPMINNIYSLLLFVLIFIFPILCQILEWYWDGHVFSDPVEPGHFDAKLEFM